MTRIMFDAVTPANIPADAAAVAGYIDGRYAWAPGDWARFRTAIRITIAVTWVHDAKCLDVETGDATPDQAPAWVRRQRANGDPHPWVYCSESVWQSVRNQFAHQGVAEPIWWIAGYPGSVGPGNLYPGAAAHQWIDDGPYDRSVLADHIPGIDPTPGPHEGEPMFVRRSDGAIIWANPALHAFTQSEWSAVVAAYSAPPPIVVNHDGLFASMWGQR